MREIEITDFIIFIPHSCRLYSCKRRVTRKNTDLSNHRTEPKLESEFEPSSEPTRSDHSN